MTPTLDQLHALRHMLGINTPADSRPRPYRNYAAVVSGDSRFVAMAADGLVELYRRATMGFDYDYYRCTSAGRAAAMRSHRDIRYSRGRRRYLVFLRIQESVPDITFKEFLTTPDFAEARRCRNN